MRIAFSVAVLTALAASLPAQIKFSAPPLFAAGIGTEPNWIPGYYGDPSVSADFNRDGYMDIATASGSSISIVLGGAMGLSQTSKPITLPSFVVISAMATADFNGDGDRLSAGV